MNHIITPVKPTDLSELAEFASYMFTQTFGHLYSEANLRHHMDTTCSQDYFRLELEAGQNRIDVMKRDGRIIAYAKYGVLALPIDEPVEPNVEIHRLYVHPEEKRQGLGLIWMEHIEAYAKANGAATIYLGVYSDNVSAQAFYHRTGFSKIGEYDYYVGDHIDHEFIFMKRL